MQVRASVKRLSADCQIVKRRGVLYVICKKNPRLKQKQKCSPRNQTSARRQNWRKRRLGAPYKSWKQR
jgi:large subunit ribosomal protein L36